MAVTLRYSGGSSNKFAQTSLGGAISVTSFATGVLNNIFDDTTRVEIINGRIDYRCFYIDNDGGTDHMKFKLKAITIPEDTEISFAVNDPGETAQLLTTEDQTPIGLTFYKFDEWNELEMAIGLMDDTHTRAIWLKRKVLQGGSGQKMVDFTMDAEDNTFTPTQDWHSIENSHDNDSVAPRSPLYLTDIALVGESLTS